MRIPNGQPVETMSDVASQLLSVANAATYLDPRQRLTEVEGEDIQNALHIVRRVLMRVKDSPR